MSGMLKDKVMGLKKVPKPRELLGQITLGIIRMFSLDSRSLALFRIWLAATTISDATTRYADAHNHYADSGMFPREFILRSFTNYYWITLHMMSGAVMVMQFLFIVEIIIAILMLIGYRTRTMTILSWIFVCSVQNRNYILGHSGDTVHRLFLFVAIWLPLARHMSVDRALDCVRKSRDSEEIDRERDRERRRFGLPAQSKFEIVNFATAMFTVQLLVMYYMAHHHKTGDEWRKKGIAAWMALQLDYFRTWFGDILLLWTPGVIFGNHAVLAWQYWGSLMYFSPVFNKYFKGLTCLGFFAMHLGFGMALYLETFTWATLAAVTGVIPTWMWDLAITGLCKFPPFSKSITIHVQPNCKICMFIARVLDEFMLPGKSKIVVSSSAGSDLPVFSGKGQDHFLGIWVTDQKKNIQYHGPAVLSVIASSSPVLYPLHFILRTKFAHKALYFVSRMLHSHPVNGMSDDPIQLEEAKFVSRANSDDAYDAKAKPNHMEAPNSIDPDFNGVVVDLPRMSKKEVFVDRSQQALTLADVKDATRVGLKAGKEVFTALLFVLIISCNAGNLDSRYGVPPSLQPIMWVFQLDQYWGMFAPRPPDITWWYNFEGELDDGTKVELFNNAGLFNFKPNIPHTWDKPNVHESIGNHRWFKLFENGLNSHSEREQIRLYFGRWFCREYNARNHGPRRVHKYSIHFVFERLNMEKLDGSRYPQSHETIWTHVCYDK